MHSYSTIKTFRRWLKENRGRFLHQPYLTLIRRDHFILRFSGVSQRICCVINKEGSACLYVNYDGESWDAIGFFDVVPMRTSGGKYFCKLCESPELFASRQDLWITHSWEPLRECMNAIFTATTWVCLYGKRTRMTWAELKQQHEVEQERGSEYFVAAFPVVGG